MEQVTDSISTSPASYLTIIVPLEVTCKFNGRFKTETRDGKL